jgi:hypothetical protein
MELDPTFLSHMRNVRAGSWWSTYVGPRFSYVACNFVMSSVVLRGAGCTQQPELLMSLVTLFYVACKITRAGWSVCIVWFGWCALWVGCRITILHPGSQIARLYILYIGKQNSGLVTRLDVHPHPTVQSSYRSFSTLHLN